MDNEYTQSDFQAFEGTLREMGINPDNIGKKSDSVLPPLPASDPASINANAFDGFYKYGSRDYWQHSQVISNKVEDWKHCAHYLMKENNEVRCNKCHVGWVVGEKFHTQDGKLYDDDKELSFV
jgi:hypothetical protein